MVFSLVDRVREPELMDQPGLDVRKHQQALQGLRRVNLLSGVSRRFWKRIQTLKPTAADGAVHVLDLACGGGDILVELAGLSAKGTTPCRFVGRDLSATAVELAQKRADSLGSKQVRFEQKDALLEDGEEQAFDVVLCNLFLHHLDPPDAVRLLAKMGRLARQRVWVDDLRRTRWGYVMAWVGCRILSRSRIVHVDGPLSVRAALSDAEMLSMADEAGLTGGGLVRHWPERFLYEWRRP